MKNQLKLPKKVHEVQTLWKFKFYKGILEQTQALQFLMGAFSENTQNKWLSAIRFSKNNVDIFDWHFTNNKIFAFFSVFRRITYFLHHTNDNVNILKVMFASSTPAYANLMRWAGMLTNSVHSGNRWLGGNLSAQIKLRMVPNFLFLPDPDDNNMIVKEALFKTTTILTINNSSSVVVGDLSLFGNNRSFKFVSQITEMIIVCLKNKPLNKNKSYTNNNWFKNC